MGSQHEISRARFLASAASGAAAAGTLAHPAMAERGTSQPPTATAADVTGDERTPQFLLLEPSGVGGRLHTAHGGLAVGVVTAEVTTEGPQPFPRKRISGVRYSHIVLRYRFGHLPELERQIARFLRGEATSLNGEVLNTDSRGDIRSRVVFSDAGIVGVKLPALDASSKDPAHLTVRLEPALARRAPGGDKVRVERPPPRWLRSDFSFRLDEADTAARSVTAIEAQIIREAAGRYEVPNLIVTLPETRAGELLQWHTDFVMRGENGPDRERRAHLSYAGLANVTFTGVGIVSIGAAAPGSGEVRAELYCEEARL